MEFDRETSRVYRFLMQMPNGKGRSFLPERTFAARRTDLVRASNPSRHIVFLNDLVWSLVVASREVLLGKQHLLKMTWIESTQRNADGRVWLEFEELGMSTVFAGCATVADFDG